MTRVEDLYARAIAVEREALARYGELARRMADLGNEAAAELFGSLARVEGEHLNALLRRTVGTAVTEIPCDLRPEARALTPRDALRLALVAECRAHAFFEAELLRADDPALRALAREMATDEAEHIELLEHLLERND